MKSQKAKWFTIVAVLILITAFMVVNLLLSKYGLSVSQYEIKSDKITSPIRIVQLTDLHNSEFGQNNQTLYEKVKRQNPDLILITGDLLNNDQDNTDIAVSLIKKLVEISKVYVSKGNHELEFDERTGKKIEEIYESAGAVVLDDSYVDIKIREQKVRLGGVYGYCLPQNYLSKNDSRQAQCDFLTDFQNTDNYKVLMSHLPYPWWNYSFGNEWNVDLVLCGHTHGGQIILPFLGGLYDGETGWFPGEVSGYKKDGADIIVSRGLGNTEQIYRFNNIPEIVTVDILKP